MDRFVEDHSRRGDDPQQAAMFSDISPEERIPQEHPLGAIRVMVDTVLKELSPHFDPLYSHTGRPSIAPAKLLRALLLPVLYTIRSERLLIEQLDYNLLFRWFVGLNLEDPVWDPSTFSKNREQLLEGDIELREPQGTPHGAQHTAGRDSAIDECTTRHPGYAVSQRKRKQVEEIFGWLKTVALLRNTRHRGVTRVG